MHVSEQNIKIVETWILETILVNIGKTQVVGKPPSGRTGQPPHPLRRGSQSTPLDALPPHAAFPTSLQAPYTQ